MPRSSTEREAPLGEEPTGATALEAENSSLRDRLLRAMAETENTRRRAEKAADDTRRYAIGEFARELLSVADNLGRALAAERGSGDALLQGVSATQHMLVATLERFGVRMIAALGAPFDPKLHEAILEVDDAGHAPGTVVQVIEDGYTIHDRLLRPARVAVAKRRSEPAAPSSGPAPS